jgi:lipopolysaccharide/colanic/teichoic acid biosynthesis glycosyltransferase
VAAETGMKRALDFFAALIGLIALAPVLVSIALVVWIEDRHAPLYRGLRVARGGCEFRMLKFRTMVPDAWKTGVYATASDDTRITRVGKWLRAAKLDELPQLWNVLIGEMSLVGPRPQVPSDARLFTSEERRLFELRPGITDLASIVFEDEGSLLRGAADADLLTQQILRPWKSRLALAYREHAGTNVFLDLRIIGLTLLAAVSPRRASAGVERILSEWHANPLLRNAIRQIGNRQAPAAWPPPGANTVVERYPRP